MVTSKQRVLQVNNEKGENNECIIEMGTIIIITTLSMYPFVCGSGETSRRVGEKRGGKQMFVQHQHLFHDN
jgi:hypothetical protein